ncbi:BtpA/SgcQ family protein [Candidatus Izemoplasma sp. B36]|uniref:BtpA/SgcQ family protein n=1 Tax=Candidatus Izemoplasma sp. B36 TaxID=3242468 RepID=UPI003556BE39
MKELFGIGNKTVIGMVHCLPLPGTAGFEDNMEKIISQAVQDAKTLEAAGCDALIVENMGDGPFNDTMDIEQSIALAAVSTLVKQAVSIPVGIDAAFNDYKTSLSIAKSIGAEFVRLPVFVDTVNYYNGTIEPCSRDAVLFRKKIHAEHVKILADIQVKHTFMVNPSITIKDSAKQAVSCLADGIIVTGTSIGLETPMEMLRQVKEVVKVPVIAGSGVNANNIKEQLNLADGAIIGSSLKEGGVISNPISLELTKKVIKGLE